MGFGGKNDRKQHAALAFAKARGDCEAVLPPNPIKYPSVYEFTA
jgi:hypothetical protein